MHVSRRINSPNSRICCKLTHMLKLRRGEISQFRKKKLKEKCNFFCLIIYKKLNQIYK